MKAAEGDNSKMYVLQIRTGQSLVVSTYTL